MDQTYPDGYNSFTEAKKENRKAAEVGKKILQIMEDEELSFEDAHKALGFANYHLNRTLLRTQVKNQSGGQV